MCTQHVSEPTHTVGHTLDLVITRDDELVSNVHVGGHISDHALVSFTMAFEIKPLRYITKEVRSWRKLNMMLLKTILVVLPSATELLTTKVWI